jgi:hypothetical protein
MKITTYTDDQLSQLTPANREELCRYYAALQHNADVLAVLGKAKDRKACERASKRLHREMMRVAPVDADLANLSADDLAAELAAFA